MRGMFNGSGFNNDSICNWDISNVKNMDSFMCDCPFDQDLSKWDVSNVEDLCSAFNSYNFERGDTLINSLFHWKPSKCEDFSYMFKDMSIFEKLKDGPWKGLLLDNYELDCAGEVIESLKSDDPNSLTLTLGDND